MRTHKNSIAVSLAKDVILFSVNLDSKTSKPEEKLHLFNTSDTPEQRPGEIVLYLSKQ
jgi:hypothetical protein